MAERAPHQICSFRKIRFFYNCFDIFRSIKEEKNFLGAKFWMIKTDKQIIFEPYDKIKRMWKMNKKKKVSKDVKVAQVMKTGFCIYQIDCNTGCKLIAEPKNHDRITASNYCCSEATHIAWWGYWRCTYWSVAARDFRSIYSYSIYSNVKNRLLRCSRVFAANTVRIDCFQ